MDEKCTIEEKDQFFSQMVALSSIYKSTKHLILLSEYYNSKQGIVISCINELRNSLDHIMRALLDITKLSDELFKAEGHLYRAVYDACEVIIIDRLKYIEDFKNEVSFSILNKVSPEYYIETLPYITSIKENLVNVRQMSNAQSRIQEYEDVVARLIEICDNLDKAIPLILEEKKKRFYLSPSILSIILGSLGLTFSLLYAFLSTTFELKTIIVISLITPIILISLVLFNRKKQKDV